MRDKAFEMVTRTITDVEKIYKSDTKKARMGADTGEPQTMQAEEKQVYFSKNSVISDRKIKNKECNLFGLHPLYFGRTDYTALDRFIEMVAEFAGIWQSVKKWLAV